MMDIGTAPRGQGDALTDLLAPDYADNLAEGHRRHPTQFAGPFVTAHISVLHPGPFAFHFEDYMRKVFEVLLDPHLRQPLYRWPAQMDPARLAHDLKELFSFHTKNIKNELLLYELEDRRFEPIDGQPSVVWRLEVNREYLSFTLFSRLKFERLPGALNISMMPGSAPGKGPSYRVPFDSQEADPDEPSRFCDQVSRILCGVMGDHVEALFRPLLDEAIGPWSAAQEADEELKRATNEGFKKTFRKPAIFARFTGPVVPWTVYGPGLKPKCVENPNIWRAWRGLPVASEARIRFNTEQGEEQKTDKCIDARPFFPRFRERGIESATLDINWALTCTNAFLSRIWPSLEGHLLNGSQEDSVACYMQSGHALYVSALGGRASPNDSSPSRYMILYDDPKGADLLGPADHSTSHKDIDCTRRISRLVGRMHDLGVARLAALSGQATVKGFAQYLRSVENKLQDLSPLAGEPGEVSRQLHELNDKLYQYLSEQRLTLYYTSTRTAFHLNVLDDLVADLNVVQVPGRQPYDRFIKRRFRASLVYLTRVGGRLQQVTAGISRRLQMELLKDQSAHTRLAALSADKIVELQATADFFAKVLAFYYVPLIFYYFIESIFKIPNMLTKSAPTIHFPDSFAIPFLNLEVPFIRFDLPLHYLHYFIETLPSIAFLMVFAILRYYLSTSIVRDLVVFSKNPKEGSAPLRLIRPLVPKKSYEAGLKAGRKKLAEAKSERLALERLVGRKQPTITD